MAEKTVSAESGSTVKTLRNLWPYMWPADRADLRARVVWATDALAGDARSVPPLPAFLLAPVMLVIAYNVVRLVQLGFNQLRDALFARVGQYAVRQLAFRTFIHMHQLSLR
ncbi:MAG: metal ABC transporter permease, partial [Mesorhizobium sp.]